MHTNSITAPLRRFAHEHDDLPAFHAGYLLIAVICAAILNLGAFALLVFAHMALDTVKYRERHKRSWKETWDGVIHESLVDITLLLVGIVFAVYLHHTIGVASLAGLLHAELSIIRSGAMLVPKLKILHDFLKIISHVRQYLDIILPRHLRGWSGLDHLCMVFSAVSLLLLVFAAPIMSVDWLTVQNVLLEELVPWNV